MIKRLVIVAGFIIFYVAPTNAAKIDDSAAAYLEGSTWVYVGAPCTLESLRIGNGGYQLYRGKDGILGWALIGPGHSVGEFGQVSRAIENLTRDGDMLKMVLVEHRPPVGPFLFKVETHDRMLDMRPGSGKDQFHPVPMMRCPGLPLWTVDPQFEIEMPRY